MYLKSHLEDYIEKLYNGISIHNPGQLNKYVIADRLDIGIYLASDPSEAFRWQERYYIFINRNLNGRQRWQDFGHELCHVLRHSGHQGHMPPPFRELQEWQADNFMYHFCVPTFMLDRMQLPSDRQRATLLLCDVFTVEYHFAETRLDQYFNKLCYGGFKVAETQVDSYT
ncbi:hypothetical protein CSV79_01790 [Sporosarcina sp. P13]|uniref:ImmA/IrrE family metallo-endopeptidase n=1 Tax=Sporosarcina sp. P13 TaxID=2048263 RepID=UPI000C163256|nr:ImmA/IrrE family metallo-endopeptidase [Sporosarcina sp. P13]PIC65377.1 hypothetical protein CSV79_01790 [Sporosarcina sp. P13]